MFYATVRTHSVRGHIKVKVVTTDADTIHIDVTIEEVSAIVMALDMFVGLRPVADGISSEVSLDAFWNVGDNDFETMEKLSATIKTTVDIDLLVAQASRQLSD